MSPDNLFKRRQTDALMGDVNRSAIPPATGSYWDLIPVFVSTCVRMVSFTEIEAQRIALSLYYQ